jgi:hypothetical protein
MSDYIEAAPVGPVPAGDIGGDEAITEGFSRRFWRPKPGAAGEWLTADVAFYYAQQEGEDGAADPYPVTLNCEMEFRVVEGDDYDSADEVYADIRYITVSGCDGEPTKDKARAACAAFDAATLAWDGTWPVPDKCWTVASS